MIHVSLSVSLSINARATTPSASIEHGTDALIYIGTAFTAARGLLIMHSFAKHHCASFTSPRTADASLPALDVPSAAALQCPAKVLAQCGHSISCTSSQRKGGVGNAAASSSPNDQGRTTGAAGARRPSTPRRH